MSPTLDARTRGLALLGILIVLVIAGITLAHTLLPFFVAFTLVYLLNPLVTYFSQCRAFGVLLGRLGGIVLVYSLFFLTIYFASLFVLPNLYLEFAKLAQVVPSQLIHFERQVLPDLVVTWQTQLDSYNVSLDIKKSLQDGMTGFFESVQGQLGEMAKRAKDLVAGVFSAILSAVLVFMLTGFLLYDLPRLQDWLSHLVPNEYRDRIMVLMRDIDRGLAGAVRGQILVCIVNGMLTTAGLFLMGVKFAITLGVVASICSLIPVFGTLISTIPTVLIGLISGFWTGVAVLVWILMIHAIEANVLNPKIIGHNAELHPALVVLALLIGEHYGGIAGLLIAVPTATVIRAIITYTLGRLLVPPPGGWMREPEIPASAGTEQMVEAFVVSEAPVSHPEPSEA